MKRKNSSSERVNQQFEKLKENLQNMYQNPEQFREWLQFNLHFHQYSPLNRSLIFFANPDAKYVASYKKWQELGYPVVKKGAIPILAPKLFTQFLADDGKWKSVQLANAKEKKKIKDKLLKTKTFVYDYRSVVVFDISATNATEEDLVKLVDVKKVDKDAMEIYTILQEEYALDIKDEKSSIYDKIYKAMKMITSDKAQEWEVEEDMQSLFHDSIVYILLEFLQLDTTLFQFQTIKSMNFEKDEEALLAISDAIIDCSQKMLVELSRII